MTDLVERLRAFIKDDYAVARPQMQALCNAAADEMEVLRDALRALLEAVESDDAHEEGVPFHYRAPMEFARAVLKEKEEA
jgi:hypothetical protein